MSEFIDPALLPHRPVRLARFDGENADPAKGRTMGEGVRAIARARHRESVVVSASVKQSSRLLSVARHDTLLSWRD